MKASIPGTNDSILDNVKQVINECIAGNRCMQNKLYEYYAPRMMSVCLRYAANRFDAEEILQESFIKVFACFNQYKSTGSLEGWIKKIVINCALQKYRQKSRQCAVINIDQTSPDNIHADVVSTRIYVKELLALIQKLPYRYRLVFNLYVFEGFNHAEIAQLLDISEGTSRSNLHDARMLLQKQLEQSRQIAKIKM